jgi:hypothetical protein
MLNTYCGTRPAWQARGGAETGGLLRHSALCRYRCGSRIAAAAKLPRTTARLLLEPGQTSSKREHAGSQRRSSPLR